MEVTLNNGNKMPLIGVGTYLMGDELNEIIGEALKIGYRLIDTARVYHNESIIGNILENLPDHFKREDLFITTKLSTADQGRGKCREAILKSLKLLKLSYLDLVLIHFPGSSRLKANNPKNAENRKGSWQDLEELQKAGLVKNIGVSNYTIRHLENLFEYATIKPVVNQIEVHPLYYKKDLIEFCQQNSIVVQAYSSFGGADGCPILFKNAILKEIAIKYKKTIAQVLLRWALQHQFCIIPKTSKKSRLKTNYDLFDFELSPEDMDKMDNLNEDRKFCWDPENIF